MMKPDEIIKKVDEQLELLNERQPETLWCTKLIEENYDKMVRDIKTICLVLRQANALKDDYTFQIKKEGEDVTLNIFYDYLCFYYDELKKIELESNCEILFGKKQNDKGKFILVFVFQGIYFEHSFHSFNVNKVID